MGGGGGGGGMGVGGGGIGGIVSGIGQGALGWRALSGGMDKRVRPDPGDRDYQSELERTLAAVRSVYPGVLEAQSEYQPATTQNELAQISAYDQYWAQQPGVAAVQRKAAGDMALGNRLSGAQRRSVEQNVRSAQAARGMGFGPADVYEETMALGGYGDQLEQQRFGNALNAMSVRNPYLSLMGSQTPNMGQLTFANPYAQDVYSGNWNRRLDDYRADLAYNDAMRMGGFQAMAQSFNTAGGSSSGFGMPSSRPATNYYSTGGQNPLYYENPATASYVGDVRSGKIPNPWE